MVRRATKSKSTQKLHFAVRTTLDVTDECLRRLYDYWSTHRESGRLPARTDVDPIELRRHCHHLALFEVRHKPLRIDLRLKVAGIESWIDNDLGGEPPSTGSSSPLQASPRACLACAAERGMPYLWVSEAHCAAASYATEALFLPFADDGVMVDAVLVASRRPAADASP
jgi:hypothetical protein